MLSEASLAKKFDAAAQARCASGAVSRPFIPTAEAYSAKPLLRRFTLNSSVVCLVKEDKKIS